VKVASYRPVVSEFLGCAQPPFAHEPGEHEAVASMCTLASQGMGSAKACSIIHRRMPNSALWLIKTFLMTSDGDFTGVKITSDPNYLAMVASEINGRPRKIHNWKTPSKIFAELVEANASTG
jgi:hypothetical protein